VWLVRRFFRLLAYLGFYEWDGMGSYVFMRFFFFSFSFRPLLDAHNEVMPGHVVSCSPSLPRAQELAWLDDIGWAFLVSCFFLSSLALLRRV
jgi:hypothetical protein